jgi:hypothetical protein
MLKYYFGLGYMEAGARRAVRLHLGSVAHAGCGSWRTRKRHQIRRRARRGGRLEAVLSGKYAIKGRKVAVAASGGNVNRKTFS